MARLPHFAEPSSYIRYEGPVLTFPSKVSLKTDDSAVELRFVRLNARESPLKYVWDFGSIAPATVSAPKTFADFEMTPNHILQTYMGISYGARARVYHPLDERLLKWDQTNLAIAEKDTANIEYEDSPFGAPRFELWVAPTQNFVPAFDVETILNDVRPARSLDVQLFFLGAKFTYEFITADSEPDTYEKLRRFQIPSRYVTFGGKI